VRIGRQRAVIQVMTQLIAAGPNVRLIEAHSERSARRTSRRVHLPCGRIENARNGRIAIPVVRIRPRNRAQFVALRRKVTGLGAFDRIGDGRAGTVAALPELCRNRPQILWVRPARRNRVGARRVRSSIDGGRLGHIGFLGFHRGPRRERCLNRIDLHRAERPSFPVARSGDGLDVKIALLVLPERHDIRSCG
jgi:hypothetical protein